MRYFNRKLRKEIITGHSTLNLMLMQLRLRPGVRARRNRCFAIIARRRNILREREAVGRYHRAARGSSGTCKNTKQLVLHASIRARYLLNGERVRASTRATTPNPPLIARIRRVCLRHAEQLNMLETSRVFVLSKLEFSFRN